MNKNRRQMGAVYFTTWKRSRFLKHHFVILFPVLWQPPIHFLSLYKETDFFCFKTLYSLCCFKKLKLCCSFHVKKVLVRKASISILHCFAIKSISSLKKLLLFTIEEKRICINWVSYYIFTIFLSIPFFSLKELGADSSSVW